MQRISNPPQQVPQQQVFQQAQPQMAMQNEPMAANDGFGAFSSF